MKDIKKLVNEEMKRGKHKYLYQAMDVVSKKIGMNVLTLNNKYYNKKNKEMDKVWKDVREHNFGIYDPELKKRINPNYLAFFWRKQDLEIGIKREVVLHRDLLIIEEIYKEKFGDQSPYDLELFKKDEGLFVERLIRAVEICTMGYVLNKGGALNKWKPATIIKGKKKFVWEQ